jgi:HK97 family phage prohead protease
VNLYDDVGRHIWVQGYASTFDTLYWHEDCLNVVKPGAFDLTRHRPFACFEHDHDERIAWTPDRSLQVWTDSTGLAFMFALPADYRAIGFCRSITGGVYRTASFCHDGDATCTYEVRGGRDVRVITRLNLTEVSPVRAAANPATGIWLDHEPDDRLPDHLRDLRAKWLAGRPQDKTAGRGEKPLAAPAAKRARVHRPPRPDSLVAAVAAGWRPRGWARALQALAKERPR